MIVWLLIVAARRKLTDNSEVVSPIPAGALVSTDDLSATGAGPSAWLSEDPAVVARGSPAAALAPIDAARRVPRSTPAAARALSVEPRRSSPRRNTLIS